MEYLSIMKLTLAGRVVIVNHSLLFRINTLVLCHSMCVGEGGRSPKVIELI
jgi:hypothetical protein